MAQSMMEQDWWPILNWTNSKSPRLEPKPGTFERQAKNDEQRFLTTFLNFSRKLNIKSRRVSRQSRFEMKIATKMFKSDIWCHKTYCDLKLVSFIYQTCRLIQSKRLTSLSVFCLLSIKIVSSRIALVHLCACPAVYFGYYIDIDKTAED